MEQQQTTELKTEHTHTDNPKICIQDLKSYNEGKLVFEWLDITEIDDIRDEISRFLKELTEKNGELHEEFMIADYSGFPNMGEFTNLDEMQEVIELMKENEDKTEAIRIFIEYGHDSEHFEDAYMGEFDDMTDFAHHCIGSCYNIEEMMGNLSSYFDFEAFGRDLELGGDYWLEDGHVFSNY